MESRRVLIVGGGVAGITAALRLQSSGFAVTLIEEQKALGGGMLSDAQPTDPAPSHLPAFLFGSDTATSSLTKELGTAHHIRSDRPMRIRFSREETLSALPSPRYSRLPGYAMASLLAFRGLGVKDRWRMASFLERTWEQDPPLQTDLEQQTGEEWLRSIGQSEEARRFVWDPLSCFLAGERIETVSAESYWNVLQRFFIGRTAGLVYAVSPPGWSTLLLDPAERRLLDAGVSIHSGTRAIHLLTEDERVAGVALQDGALLKADWYVLALSPHALIALLSDRVLTHYAYFHEILGLVTTPRLFVSMTFDRTIESQIILLTGGSFQWLMIQPSAVPSGAGSSVWLASVGQPEHLTRPASELLDLALKDLAATCPALRNLVPMAHRIVKDSSGTMSVRPGSRHCRPLATGPFSNCFLTGAWTDTNLPPRVESAIVSAERCAEAVMQCAARAR